MPTSESKEPLAAHCPEERRKPARHMGLTLGLAIAAGALLVGFGEARGQNAPQEAPLLLGGPLERDKNEAPMDPALPSGAIRWLEPRPETSPAARRCSRSRPVCVHGGSPELRTASLGAIERAYERLVYGARLPAPAADEGAGGGDQLDWYLGSEAPLGAAPPPEDAAPPDAGQPEVRLESLPSRGFDRAAAYCHGHASDLERAATLCVGEASAAARAPALGPAQRRAYATHLGWTLRTPTAEDEAAVFRAQHAPERGVLGRHLDELSSGSGLFFEYLDRLGEPRAPAVTSTSALALAATRTSAGALRWHAEPDVADVVRSTFSYQRERVARFWDEFASARFLVDRPGSWLSWPGASGSVRRAWTIKSSSLPRNLVLPRPLSPTGSAYVVVEMDHARSLLAFRATCEGPVSWVWTALRFDAEGRELARLHVPFQERKATTEQRISQLDETRLLVLVGTNLGGVDLTHPFDPDFEPFEPHGCTVYLTAQVL